LIDGAVAGVLEMLFVCSRRCHQDTFSVVVLSVTTDKQHLQYTSNCTIYQEIKARQQNRLIKIQHPLEGILALTFLIKEDSKLTLDTSFKKSAHIKYTVILFLVITELIIEVIISAKHFYVSLILKKDWACA
jgi:hypothetical protein